MAQFFPPITSSMPKMFSIHLFLSYSLQWFDMVLSQLLSVIVSLFPYLSLVRIHLIHNYHPVALAPTLSPYFKRSVWMVSSFQISVKLRNISLFGFKPGFSSDLCTGLLKNVIHKYLVNNSHVYGCFLDASKAFDCVDHSLLFEKLLNRDLPPVITRLLLSWYCSQQLKVSWAKTFSNWFHTTNGVRQGGVLSPIYFTVYIHELLIALENCGYGCFWKHHFVGALCYTDDISLLAPSPSALRHMLDTCLSFAIQHHLTFNPDKTQLIKFYKCMCWCYLSMFHIPWSVTQS